MGQKKLKTILIIVIVLLVLAVAAVVAVKVMNSGKDDSVEVANTNVTEFGDESLGIDATVDEQLQGYENIMVLVLDIESIKDEEGEIIKDDVVADSNVVFSVNNETHDVHMFLVLRTTPLKLNDQYGFDRIMDAYEKGGVDLSLYAMNSNLDLNMREYIVLTWKTVRTTVDELGGIELDIPASDIPYINKLLSSSNQITESGLQEVNGEQAVQYCRYIVDGDDEARHERFKKVLEQAYEKAEGISDEETIRIAEIVMETIDSNIPNQHITEMMVELTKHEVIAADVWPFTEEDMASNVSDMHEFMFDQKDYEPTDRVKNISEALKNE